MIPNVNDRATAPRRLAGSIGRASANRLVALGARRFDGWCRASSPEDLTGAALDPGGRLRPEVLR